MIISILGARPQFVKAAAVSRVFAQSGISETIIHTGQHYDDNMSQLFFDELDITPPAINLGIGGGSHGRNTGRMLEALEQALVDLKPTTVLVYGDTDSTLAGALAASKLGIRVAHVEAGLRSFNRAMPEEINRVLVDHLSGLLFAPTENAMTNLGREGIAGAHLVGDVMFDAAIHFGTHAAKRGPPADGLPEVFALATVHRASNTDDRDTLAAILDGFAKCPLPIVLPLHPRTKARLESFDLAVPPTVRTLPPVGFLDMIWLERHASVILTDSGGVQKEAYFHGTPCVTLREETEWSELVDVGWNRLCSPTDGDAIRAAVVASLSSRPETVSLYGDGTAADAIAQILLDTTSSG